MAVAVRPGAPARRGGSRSAPVVQSRPAKRVRPRPAKRERAFELDTIACRWQRALDSAVSAVSAAGGRGGLRAPEVNLRQRELASERRLVEESLVRLAADVRITPAPWLSPVPVTPQMLGLPATTSACLFDLDGVLTNSDAVHATAWAEVLDDFLLHRSAAVGWPFRPFDPDADYRLYIAGRPRLEGIHTFLESRGLRLEEGRPSDERERQTAYALAERKSEALARALRRGGLAPVPHARRYLEAAGHAGLARVVLSASASTSKMLELAGLASLADAVVDADTLRGEHLRSRPAPDVVFAACSHVDVPPAAAVAFTGTPAGVAAALAAGASVIGVGEGDLLRGFGAQRTIPSLAALLDRRLLDTRP